MPIPKSVKEAVSRGWSVIPVRADKRPAIESWKPFQKRRPTNEELDAWAARPGITGWAVITGAISGFVILDFDGEPGNKLLERLKIPPHVRTGSGGHHVYVEHPGWHVPTLNSKSKYELGEKYAGLDIRADGGYAVFLGANKNGKYRWLRRAVPEKLSALPAELRRALNLAASPEQPQDAPPRAIDPNMQAYDLVRKAVGKTAAEGRNNGGFWLACQLRDNGLSQAAAEPWMRQFANCVPDTNSKGQREPYRWIEAQASLREAYNRTAREPLGAKKRPPAARQDQPKQDPAPERPRFRGKAYEMTDKGLMYWKPSKEGFVPVMLTNFPATIVNDVVRDDGATQVRAFKIHAKVRGEERNVVVTSGEFSKMEWPLDMLGVAAIVYPNYRDYVRTAMQELAGPLQLEHVYQHMGWTQRRGEWIYLHAGGAISAAGQVKDIQVDLDGELRRYQLPDPPLNNELVSAVRNSLRLLDVAPDRLTVPLFASIWASVLDESRFSIHVSGESGAGKSALVALFQQHFGAGMDADHLPAGWDSTANALEALAFRCKNALITVDDFVPRGSIADVQRMQLAADRLLRAQGNHTGRQRMYADTRLRPRMYPRGLIISTGEDVPGMQSLRARMLVLEMEKYGDMNWPTLTECQQQAMQGVYAGTLAAYLRWLAPQIQDVQGRYQQYLPDFRRDWDNAGGHKRLPDTIAALSFGLKIFLDFSVEVRALRERDAGEIWWRAMKAFESAAAAQQEQHGAVECTTQFLDLLRAVLASGQAHLAAREGGVPRNASAYGWREERRGADLDWRPGGSRIGWVDGDDVYLEPQASYAAVQRMGRDSGSPLMVSQSTLTRRLKQRRLLLSCDGRHATTKRHCEGVMRRVLHFSGGGVWGEKSGVCGESEDLAIGVGG